MSVTLTSTTSTPEEVRQALEHFGEVESVESITEGEEPQPELEPEPAPEPVAAAPAEPEVHAEDDLGLTDAERRALSAGAWKQFNKVTKQRYEEKTARAVAEAQLAETRQRLADLESKLEAKNSAKPPEPEVKAPAEAPNVEAKPEPKPKPKAEDFEGGVYDPGYIDALMDWRDEQREIKEAAKTEALRRELEELKARITPEKTQAEVQAELDRQERAAQFMDQVENFKQDHPDYEEVANNTEVMVSGPMADAILDDPDSRAAMFYHLGKNPEDAKRIFEATKLDVDAKGNITTPPHILAQRIRIAAREHARILSLIQKPPATAETSALAKPEPKPKSPVTKAPPPIKPGSSTSAPSTGINPYEMRANDPMSVKQFNEWRDRNNSQRRN